MKKFKVLFRKCEVFELEVEAKSRENADKMAWDVYRDYKEEEQEIEDFMERKICLDHVAIMKLGEFLK